MKTEKRIVKADIYDKKYHDLTWIICELKFTSEINISLKSTFWGWKKTTVGELDLCCMLKQRSYGLSQY